MHSEDIETPAYVWCPGCRCIQPALIEDLRARDTTGAYRGGDIVCEKCAFIVATVYKEAE